MLQVQELLYVEIESVCPGWHTQCKEYSYDEDKCTCNFNPLNIFGGNASFEHVQTSLFSKWWSLATIHIALHK